MDRVSRTSAWCSSALVSVGREQLKHRRLSSSCPESSSPGLSSSSSSSPRNLSRHPGARAGGGEEGAVAVDGQEGRVQMWRRLFSSLPYSLFNLAAKILHTIVRCVSRFFELLCKLFFFSGVCTPHRVSLSAQHCAVYLFQFFFFFCSFLSSTLHSSLSLPFSFVRLGEQRVDSSTTPHLQNSKSSFVSIVALAQNATSTFLCVFLLPPSIIVFSVSPSDLF